MMVEADNVFLESGIEFSFDLGVYAKKLGSTARDASLPTTNF
jgi:hypothetical protein